MLGHRVGVTICSVYEKLVRSFSREAVPFYAHQQSTGVLGAPQPHPLLMLSAFNFSPLLRV